MAKEPLDDEWDEAYARVESYLCAHHIFSPIQLARLTSEIITAARALSREYPAEALVTLAIQAAHARIGEWMQEALGEGDWADARFRSRGRLAVWMADIPEKTPQHFLSQTELPTDVRERLVSARLEAGPKLRLAGMPPAPLDVTLKQGVAESWSTFSRSSLLHASMSWIVIAGIAGFAWLVSR